MLWSGKVVGSETTRPLSVSDHSMDYYAIFMVESYELTFRDHSDFNGVYFFGDDLPTLEGDAFNAFLGWYRTGEDEDINDAFLTVPDLGYDGDEVELAANQRPHQLHIHFELPFGYEAISDVVSSNFTTALPKIASPEEGHYFKGWSFVGGDGNYGEDYSDAVCLNKVSEAVSYMDYLETAEEDGELHMTLYPVLPVERYQIKFYGATASSTLGDLSTAHWYTYGDALPTYSDYADNGGNTVGYVGLAGWSTKQSGDGQTTENTHQTVVDLGDNEAEISLYANLRSEAYKIHFRAETQGHGKYANGKTEFTSSDYFYNDECPAFIPSDGYAFEGYYIVEDNTGNFSGSMTVPNLADRTLFEAPSQDGAYQFIPIAAALGIKMKYAWSDPKTLNLPTNVSTSDAILGGLECFNANGYLFYGRPFVRNQAGDPFTIGPDIIKLLGYHLAGIELYGTTDTTSDNPAWTKITTYEVGEPAVLKGIKDDASYAANKLYMFKCLWEVERQEFDFTYQSVPYKMKWSYKAQGDYTAFYKANNTSTSLAWSAIAGRHGTIRMTVEIISGVNIGSQRIVTLVKRPLGETKATWTSYMPFLQSVPDGMSNLKIEKIVSVNISYGD